MPLLENNKTIENIEPSAGVTQPKEFVYTDDPTVSVPSGVVYHKIRTKNKRVVYQTSNKPHTYSQKISRVKNKSTLEGYLVAKSFKPPISKYFKNEKVEPKKADYKKGFFTRYFLQLASDDKAPVIEVKKGDYARADTVYFKENVRWSLSKDKEEQKKLNLNNILRVEKTFPQIRMKIYNFVEFHKKG